MTESAQKILTEITQKLDVETPELAKKFAEFAKKADSADLTQFIAEVDDSNYSLADWAAAFLGFKDWLQAEHSDPEMNFSNMLGYLHCCQMMISDNLEQPELQVIVIQCLNEFGYDFSQPSQT